MDELLKAPSVLALLGTLVAANSAVIYGMIRLLTRMLARAEKGECAFIAALKARDASVERERDKDRESRHYLANRVEVLAGATQRFADLLPAKIAEALS